MNGTILLVDDEPSNVQLLETMLSKVGRFDIHGECDSAVAWELVQEREFDLLITDIVMPEPDGLELLRRTKERWPDMEVIVLSGLVTIDRAIESLKLHAFDFLPKPVKLEKLRNTVRNALERQRLVKENKRMTEELREYNVALQARVDEATAELQGKLHELDILSNNYRAILDHMPSGCLILDGENRVYQINEFAATTLGLGGAEEATGTTLPADMFRADPLLDCIAELKAGAPALKTDVMLPNRDGPPTRLRCAISRVVTTSDVEFVVTIFDDVTELTELQRQFRKQERLATVGGLAAGIAHEIKNPLGAIRGLGELISMKMDAVSTLKKYADNIMTEVDRLNRIINDINRFSREVTPSLQDVDLGKLLSELAKAYGTQSQRRHIVVTLAADVPTIPYDYAQMKQALENILDNAVQATEEGGQITIRTEKADGKLALTIEDDGGGISEESLSRIFRPFYSTCKAKGSGLGLTIAEKVIQDHGGTIRVASQEGKGTCVTILLPAPSDTIDET